MSCCMTIFGVTSFGLIRQFYGSAGWYQLHQTFQITSRAIFTRGERPRDIEQCHLIRCWMSASRLERHAFHVKTEHTVQLALIRLLVRWGLDVWAIRWLYSPYSRLFGGWWALWRCHNRNTPSPSHVLVYTYCIRISDSLSSTHSIRILRSPSPKLATGRTSLMFKAPFRFITYIYSSRSKLSAYRLAYEAISVNGPAAHFVT